MQTLMSVHGCTVIIAGQYSFIVHLIKMLDWQKDWNVETRRPDTRTCRWLTSCLSKTSPERPIRWDMQTHLSGKSDESYGPDNNMDNWIIHHQEAEYQP